MSDEIRVISSSGVPATGGQQIIQTGADSVAIPNYGNLNLTVNQYYTQMPYFGGNVYVPPKVDREYYNIFVVGAEEFDRPYFRLRRDRALTELMTEETKRKFEKPTEENLARIKTMPSLFMAENMKYGKADDGQMVIYGFIPDLKIYDTEIKVYYCGWGMKILQQKINDLLAELQLDGNDKFNELNRTHWSIKRCDLIEELLEAGVQVPVPMFTMGTN